MEGITGVIVLVELAVLGVIAVYDLRTLRAPNAIVYPALVFALVAAVLLEGAGLQAWLGAGAAFALTLALAIVSRGAMGMGDVKVAALCGAIVGLKGVPMMLTLAFVVAGVISLVLLLMRLRSRHDAIALTPFLGLGAAVTVLLA